MLCRILDGFALLSCQEKKKQTASSAVGRRYSWCLTSPFSFCLCIEIFVHNCDCLEDLCQPGVCTELHLAAMGSEAVAWLKPLLKHMPPALAREAS